MPSVHNILHGLRTHTLNVHTVCKGNYHCVQLHFSVLSVSLLAGFLCVIARGSGGTTCIKYNSLHIFKLKMDVPCFHYIILPRMLGYMSNVTLREQCILAANARRWNSDLWITFSLCWLPYNDQHVSMHIWPPFQCKLCPLICGEWGDKGSHLILFSTSFLSTSAPMAPGLGNITILFQVIRLAYTITEQYFFIYSLTSIQWISVDANKNSLMPKLRYCLHRTKK